MNNLFSSFSSLNKSKELTVPPASWCIALIPFVLWVLIYQYEWNTPLFLYLNHSFQVLPDVTWTIFSLLGNGWSLFAIVIPILIISPRTIYACLITGLIAGVVANISKTYFDAPRPAGILDPTTFHIIETPLLHSAMPSGHTLTAFAIITAIVYSTSANARGSLLPLWLLAVFAGLSRIAVGAHWPVDVLIGASLGILCGLMGCKITLKIPEKYNQPFSLPARIILLFSFLDAYILIFDTLDFHLNQPVQYVLSMLILVNFLFYCKSYWQHRKITQINV